MRDRSSPRRPSSESRASAVRAAGACLTFGHLLGARGAVRACLLERRSRTTRLHASVGLPADEGRFDRRGLRGGSLAMFRLRAHAGHVALSTACQSCPQGRAAHQPARLCEWSTRPAGRARRRGPAESFPWFAAGPPSVRPAGRVSTPRGPGPNRAGSTRVASVARTPARVCSGPSAAGGRPRSSLGCPPSHPPLRRCDGGHPRAWAAEPPGRPGWHRPRPRGSRPKSVRPAGLLRPSSAPPGRGPSRRRTLPASASDGT